MDTTKQYQGFAGFLPVIIIGLILVSSLAIFSSQNVLQIFSLEPPIPTATAINIISRSSPTPAPSVSPSPTPTPTPIPIPPTPTLTPKPSPTPRPTLHPVSGPPGAGLSTISVATSLGNFRATVLAFNLGNTKIITDSASDNDCADNCPVNSLAAFVAKNGGFAGINGTYFCPVTYPDCAGKTNSFDFPIYNSRLNHWINGGNLFWNSRSLFYVDGSGAHYLQNAKDFGGSLSAGIVNFPGLLEGGNVQIDSNQSGLSDKQKAVGTKVGIGLKDSQNVYVVVASSVNMHQFAHVFKSLGASGALNLDTGGSLAMIYSGRYIFGPGRDLPNAIIFASR